MRAVQKYVNEDGLLPVFTYGTLRIGEWNYRWASDAVVSEIPNVTTKGRLYFVHDRGGYPVAVFRKEGEIQGDLLFMKPDHRATEQVIRMEIGARYKMVEIEVFDGTGSLRAVAFDYGDNPRDTYGERIESGNWHERQAV